MTGANCTSVVFETRATARVADHEPRSTSKRVAGIEGVESCPARETFDASHHAASDRLPKGNGVGG